MYVILNPDPWRARRADSLPAPGPFTSTPTCRTPCSIAFFATSSAQIWAAKGVDFRDPLKPTAPQEVAAMVLPATSVIVTTVLLKVAWMWATPVWMFFLIRFLTRFAFAMIRYFFATDFFFPATVFLGPFRVRAFVWVLCPCTGSPRRCRRPR